MEADLSGRIDRRRFLRIAGVAGLSLAGVACGAPAANPAPSPAATTPPKSTAATELTASPKAATAEEAQAKLVEAAKKEGRLSIYDSAVIEDLENRAKAFKKAYPFMEFDLYRGDSGDLTEKAITEAKAGRNQVDVIRASAGGMVPLVDRGLTMKYKSPSAIDMPKDSYDPEGAWYYPEHMLHVIAYNTKLISPAEAPKSYEDLADPRFQGKLAIEAECTEWFTQMKSIMGEAKFLDLARRIAANKPRPIKGHGTLARLVVTGETPVAVMIYQHRAQMDKESKAPVDWVFGSKPVTTSPVMLLLMKDAPHPNAAKLYLDWCLSKQGQEEDVVKVMNRFPLRSGVDLPGHLKGVQVFNPPLENVRLVNEVAPQFRQVFDIQ